MNLGITAASRGPASAVGARRTVGDVAQTAGRDRPLLVPELASGMAARLPPRPAAFGGRPPAAHVAGRRHAPRRRPRTLGALGPVRLGQAHRRAAVDVRTHPRDRTRSRCRFRPAGAAYSLPAPPRRDDDHRYDRHREYGCGYRSKWNCSTSVNSAQPLGAAAAVADASADRGWDYPLLLGGVAVMLISLPASARARAVREAATCESSPLYDSGNEKSTVTVGSSPAQSIRTSGGEAAAPRAPRPQPQPARRAPATICSTATRRTSLDETRDCPLCARAKDSSVAVAACKASGETDQPTSKPPGTFKFRSLVRNAVRTVSWLRFRMAKPIRPRAHSATNGHAMDETNWSTDTAAFCPSHPSSARASRRPCRATDGWSGGDPVVGRADRPATRHDRVFSVASLLRAEIPEPPGPPGWAAEPSTGVVARDPRRLGGSARAPPCSSSAVRDRGRCHIAGERGDPATPARHLPSGPSSTGSREPPRELRR